MNAEPRIDYETLSDADLAARIAARDAHAVRLVVGRNNQRLYRAAWSILKARPEAEDAVQDAYLKGFRAIGGFKGEASLSTWLTRIVINEALGRRRTRERQARLLDAGSVVSMDEYREKLMRGSDSGPGQSPEASLARTQITRLLEAAIARLPEDFRLVFVLRDVEGLSVEETAQALGVLPQTIKTRHLRARRRLQEDLGLELRGALSDSFTFAGADCAALTARVIEALGRGTSKAIASSRKPRETTAALIRLEEQRLSGTSLVGGRQCKGGPGSAPLAAPGAQSRDDGLDERGNA